LNAFLVWLSLKIIEFASALTLVLLALGWALRHVGEAAISLAMDVAHLRSRINSVEEQSELEQERGLSSHIT
jgi:hypothetical protein